MTTRAVYLRLGGALLALLAGGAGVVVAVALLRSVPGPVGATTSILGGAASTAAPGLAGGAIPTPEQPGFPAPPQGALVLARQAGRDALALALVRGTPRSLVRVSVVSPTGPGAAGLRVAAAFGGRPAVSLPACGEGCYQAELATGSSRRVRVSLDGRSYGFTLPAAPDPPDGSAIVARATAVWRALKTLVWHEVLDGIHDDYVAVAPDELSYTVGGRSQAVIIGTTSWDRPSEQSPWVRSAQLPVRQPIPFWYSVDDARTIGSTRLDGQSVWTVSFFDPVTAAWFEAEIAKSSGRTLRLEMITASHFMFDDYGPFNTSVKLHPPAGT